MTKNSFFRLTSCFVLAGFFSVRAETVFFDDFDTNGSLNGSSADIGGAWNVTSGDLAASGGAVDTASSSSSNPDLALAYFTRALAINETLTLTFLTVESSGSFAASGWAGISLFENGNEQVFLGSPGFVSSWGIDGPAIGSRSSFSPAITDEAQTAVFEYIFNTGAWTFTVNGQQLSGTATSGLAFDQIRIGADGYNYADIAVSQISVTAIPEPATALSLALGALFLSGYRRFFGRF
jgi:hypothetical protein